MPSSARAPVLACAAVLVAGAVAGSCGPEGSSNAGGSVGASDGGGSDGGGAPDAGGGSPDGGGGGGSPDAGGGGGGGGGGGPPAECAGLTPAAPGSPQTYSHAYYTAGGFCGYAQGDGTGVVALQVQDDEHPAWRFVAPNGSELGTTTMWAGNLYQQPNRYTGFIFNRNTMESYFVQAEDEHGAHGGGSEVFTPDPSLSIRWPDPNGGLFIAGKVSASSAQPATPQAWMFQPDGTTRWGPNPLGTSAAIFGVGVDLLGRALVITDGGGGTIDGIWFDRNGTRMTDFFPIVTNFSAGPATWFEAAPLIGGGLAVRRVDAPSPGATTGWHSQWIATVPSGNPNAQGAPDWLTSRPDTWIEPVRGNTAYAVLPMGAQGTACDQKVEVLAPDGASCGSLDFPIASSTCDTFDLRLGVDGTVLQKLPASLEQAPGAAVRNCTVRFWPALLK